MNKTSIEWTDYSTNPFYVTVKETGKRGWHCDKPSAGCGHCYSEGINKRFGTGFAYKSQNAHLLDFHVSDKELGEILKRDRILGNRGEHKLCFPFDMTDVFLDEHSDELLIRTFAVFAVCKNLTFQILTKRSERMMKYFNRFNPPLNFWIGVSVENIQQKGRIEHLRQTPAAVRFLSIEPQLEDVGELDLSGIHQVIVGGESGTHRRGFATDWARSIRDQCKEQGVSFFMKQVDKVRPIPEDLMIKEFPR